MTTIRARFRLLESHAKLSGLVFDYADGQQNGQDCWFDATLVQLRRRGFRLAASFTVQVWRNETRQWMLERAERLEPFGNDHFEFVEHWKTAWITEPAMIAALSVLSARLQVDLEAVALATVGSDHVDPIKSEPAVSHWGVTVRLMYGFDPERHWVAMVDASLDGEHDALRRVEESRDAELRRLVASAETFNEVVHAEAEARLQEQEERRRRCAAVTATMRSKAETTEGMSAAAGPAGRCSDPPQPKRTRNSRRRAGLKRFKAGEVAVDGPPEQLWHGPLCGPARLNGWADRSIWEKVRVRSQEAVFSTGAWLPRVVAAESGQGWPASHVPCVADRRSLLLALKIDEIEGNAADELSSATVPIPPNGVACVYEPGGRGQSTALVGVGMAVLCDRLVCPQESRLARSMHALSQLVGLTNFAKLMGDWARGVRDTGKDTCLDLRRGKFRLGGGWSELVPPPPNPSVPH